MAREARTGDFLDRTEQFVDWLEGHRVRLGISQEKLAAAGGMSHSYYSKIVSLKSRRAKWGDKGRMIQAPTNPEAMLKTLQELSRLSGKDLVSEGYEVWGVEPPATQPESKGSEDNILLLAEIFDKIAELPVEARKLLVALIVSP